VSGYITRAIEPESQRLIRYPQIRPKKSAKLDTPNGHTISIVSQPRSSDKTKRLGDILRAWLKG